MLNTIESSLRSAHIDGNSLSFPVDISRSTYTKVKGMLTDIRGKWLGGKSGKFVFDFNPSSLIETYLNTGEWPKKNPFALFPTPQAILDYATQYTYAGAQMWHGYEVVRILEPSGGTGAFIDAVVKEFEVQGIPVEVTCAEIDPINAAILREKGYNVIEGDFLALTQEQLGEFDLIIINPPFQGTAYIKHVNHAQSFLQKHGKLIAVIPTTLFTSDTKLAVDLKQKVTALNIGEFPDCIFESGTFENTKVETMIVVLNSVERTQDDMKQIQDYAVNLMHMTLTNDPKANNYINQLRSEKSIKEYLPELTSFYLSLSPYAFVNDAIVNQLATDIFDTIEVNDELQDFSEIEPQEDESIDVDALKNGEEKISSLLNDIGQTMDDIKTKCSSKKTIKEDQLELDLCA